MEKEGGFDHNCQGLRQVSRLESRYLGIDGLNLTCTTLQGLMKHGRLYSCDRQLQPLLQKRKEKTTLPEARLADICDSIAYLHHDIEDGLDAGLLCLEQLRELDIFQRAYHYLNQKEGRAFQQARLPLKARLTLRQMLNRSISDLIETSALRLKRTALSKKEEFPALLHHDSLIHDSPIHDSPISCSQELQKELAQAKQFLLQNLYRHPEVVKMSHRAEEIIKTLFSQFLKRPQHIPEHYRLLIKEYGNHRIAADYIAGMTDRFAEEYYRQMKK